MIPAVCQIIYSNRIGWLRAAVLGGNDGIISTASLIVGVAAAAATPNDVLIAGTAGLVAGAISMAVGEYVSTRSGGTLRVGHRTVFDLGKSRHVGQEWRALLRGDSGAFTWPHRRTTNTVLGCLWSRALLS